MIEIIHISDLHFMLNGLANEKKKKFLEGIGLFCKERQDKPYVLVTGDFTQHGKPGEYEAAARALERFTRPGIFITPGNHDYGSFFGMLYFEDRARYFDKYFAGALGISHPFFEKRVFVRNLNDESDNSSLILIGLNSCTKEGLHDYAQGKIGAGQMEELKAILDGFDPELPKILFLHHIPYKRACGGFAMSLLDWEKLMGIIRGRVSVLAFGHQGLFMRINYIDKFRRSGRETRPMGLRCFDMDSHRVSRLEKMSIDTGLMDKRHVQALDANNCSGQGCFYYITCTGRRLQCEIRSINPRGSWDEPF